MPRVAEYRVPEATFPTMDDLQAFIKASRVQMEDGINFLSQEIGYAVLGPNSTTVRDATDLIAKGLKSDAPLLIDVPVDRNYRPV